MKIFSYFWIFEWWYVESSRGELRGRQPRTRQFNNFNVTETPQGMLTSRDGDVTINVSNLHTPRERLKFTSKFQNLMKLTTENVPTFSYLQSVIIDQARECLHCTGNTWLIRIPRLNLWFENLLFSCPGVAGSFWSFSERFFD